MKKSELKRELQQDQEKTTKTNKNQIKPKQKRKAQQNSNQNNQRNKTKQKNVGQKIELMLSNRDWLFLVAEGLEKRANKLDCL